MFASTLFPAEAVDPLPTEYLLRHSNPLPTPDQTIIVRRGPRGFGFTVRGAVVETVTAGSSAAAAGLTPGVRLLR